MYVLTWFLADRRSYATLRLSVSLSLVCLSLSVRNVLWLNGAS